MMILIKFILLNLLFFTFEILLFQNTVIEAEYVSTNIRDALKSSIDPVRFPIGCLIDSCPELQKVKNSYCSNSIGGSFYFAEALNQLMKTFKVCMKQKICGLTVDPLAISNIELTFSGLPNNESIFCKIGEGTSLMLEGFSNVKVKLSSDEAQSRIFSVVDLTISTDSSLFNCGKHQLVTVSKFSYETLITLEIQFNNVTYEVVNADMTPPNSVPNGIRISGTTNPATDALMQHALMNYFKSNIVAEALYYDAKLFFVNLYKIILNYCHPGFSEPLNLPHIETQNNIENSGGNAKGIEFLTNQNVNTGNANNGIDNGRNLPNDMGENVNVGGNAKGIGLSTNQNFNNANIEHNSANTMGENANVGENSNNKDNNSNGRTNANAANNNQNIYTENNQQNTGVVGNEKNNKVNVESGYEKAEIANSPNGQNSNVENGQHTMVVASSNGNTSNVHIANGKNAPKLNVESIKKALNIANGHELIALNDENNHKTDEQSNQNNIKVKDDNDQHKVEAASDNNEHAVNLANGKNKTLNLEKVQSSKEVNIENGKQGVDVANGLKATGNVDNGENKLNLENAHNGSNANVENGKQNVDVVNGLKADGANGKNKLNLENAHNGNNANVDNGKQAVDVTNVVNGKNKINSENDRTSGNVNDKNGQQNVEVANGQKTDVAIGNKDNTMAVNNNKGNS